MPFGAELVGPNTVRFRIWAPSQSAMTLVVGDGARDQRAMEAVGDGWFELTLSEGVGAGTLYRYRLGNGTEVPDPASRFQPRDVHGPSQIVDPAAFAWRNGAWSGRRWEDTVLYELHVGCFSDEGTFDGVRRRLDHFARLGVSAIELMPLADFEGARNWGYDGVLPFAPDASYGPPDTLKRLIDEAHERELMVFLDVVYNHFGPTGNYLSQYAAQFFTERHHTPWGAAINFDDVGSRSVRDLFVHNALYWINEYRFDGLRFDAVHAILDDGNRHILDEIATEVRSRVDSGRHVHLVLENDDNVARFLDRTSGGRPRFYDAQWNDDFHHCAHVIATGEQEGYYADYATNPVASFGRVLTEGFAYQGEPSHHRGGRPRGEPSAHLPPTAFVSFLQNHDQIGNRAFGERLTTLAEPPCVRALQAIHMLAPEIPLLFMGEEWASRRPFLFFCDFADELADAVRDGRRREFERFPAFRDPAARDRIPDPNAASTFEESRLDWARLDSDEGRADVDFMRSLIDVRARRIAPLLNGAARPGTRHAVLPGGALAVEWPLAGRGTLHLVANLASAEAHVDWRLPGEPIFAIPAGIGEGDRVRTMPPWSVLFAISDGGGPR
ncbi:MAG: malto-oligosyltrehalose trehalohydrolase [Gemmatimonas sp.]